MFYRQHGSGLSLNCRSSTRVKHRTLRFYMESGIFYLLTLILIFLGYLTYGWYGSFWVMVVMIIPILMFTSACIFFAKIKFSKKIRKDPEMIGKIIREVLNRND